MVQHRRYSMPWGIVFLVLLALAIAFPLTNVGQPQARVSSSPDIVSGADLSDIEETLSGAVSSGALQGVSLLLMKNDQVLFKKAYGNLSPDSRVRIASSTKPIAAFGVLLLVDDGKLSLDDTIGELLPEFRGTRVEGATLRQLLSHQAGVRGNYPGGRPRKGSLAEFSELISKRGTLRDPGDFSYSGVSIDIACRMAEVAAGIPIEEHLRTRVWLPLDMTHSAFNLAADPGSVSAAQRARGEGRYVSCGGGMESTLDDVANFYEMLLNGGVYNGKRLISEELYTDMISEHARNPRKLNDPYTTGEYGYGIYRDRVGSGDAPLTISHGGALGTMPWVDLDSGLVGVFFSQKRLSKVQPLIAEVQAEARGFAASSVASAAESAPTDESVQQSEPDQVSGGGSAGSSENAFMNISGGADVINLKQFQDHIKSSPGYSRLRENPDLVVRVFKRLDQNSDGVLTVEEYREIKSIGR